MDDLVGKVLPCKCNGLSDTCEMETGKCNNCTENTGGDSCEVCGEGFYGDPNSRFGCQPHYKGLECVYSETDGVKCVCKTGSEGEKCDKCMPGYFGDPKSPNGTCTPCNCHPSGSSSNTCDAKTGQCSCNRNRTGTKCNKCLQKGFYYERGDCHCKYCKANLN